ncbi:hypothetical protein ACWDUI_38785, partial [Streptosporangium sandarakinum]
MRKLVPPGRPPRQAIPPIARDNEEKDALSTNTEARISLLERDVADLRTWSLEQSKVSVAILAALGDLQKGQEELRKGQEGLRAEVGGLREGQEALRKDQEGLRAE